MALVPAPLKECAYNEKFLTAAYPHIASFNLFLNHYVKEIPKSLESVYIDIAQVPQVTGLDPFHFPAEYLTVSVSRVDIGLPRRWDNETNGNSDMRQFPVHARLAHVTYGAPMYITYVWNNSSGKKVKERTVLSGVCPILVRSDHCHLSELSPFEMAHYAREDIDEIGGYFIVNGNERGVRFVIQQRCNFPIAVNKPRFKDRDIFFTEHAVFFRSARRDGTSTNNIVFYTEDNQCVFRILLNRAEWTCPFWVLLKALCPTVQLKLLRQKILELATNAELLTEFDDLWNDMIREDSALTTDQDYHEDRYLSLLGYQFYDGVVSRLPPRATYESAARYVIQNYILVHTDDWSGKFETLLLMWQKLWLLKTGQIPAENVDSFCFQEVLGPGQLFAAVLKDSLFNSLQQIKLQYLAEIRNAGGGSVTLSGGGAAADVIRSESIFEQIVSRACQGPAKALSYFCATGNIRTFQLDLQQTAGWTITADKLNMNRFVAHFRAIHRGQFFAKMRTTEVRKLVGETWGFVCPVHTPDGPCCGLLLHMSKDAVVVSDAPDGRFRAVVIDWLYSQGYQTNMTGRVLAPAVMSGGGGYPIVIDGEPVCRLPRHTFDHIARELKTLKQNGAHGFPPQAEICAFKREQGVFEGIFLYSYPGRLVRPVKDLASQKVEWIGSLAQPWLKIACSEQDVAESKRVRAAHSGVINEVVGKRCDGSAAVKTEAGESRLLTQTAPVDYDYVEISPTSFLSINASFTPLSNHNQSPRNMYQCQMLKQTMGTPFHNIAYRTDNKTYRLLTPNRPLVRTADYNDYNFDYYGSGTNAVVAVISYTGFDMEDAMIINKQAMERGVFEGCVYKTKVVDAAPAGCKLIDMRNFVFSNRAASGRKWEPNLDIDGLPIIGSKLVRGSPLYRTEDLRLRTLDSADIEGHAGHVHAYNEDEEAFVEKVHLITSEGGSKKGVASPPSCQRVLITLRCIRRPILGDKFASRAGQKGILSLLYPPEDLPFSASGIVPDLVFNPHGFPSRMTIGMVVESMAGKLAAITGQYQSATPFQPLPLLPNKENRWIDQGGYHGWRKRGGRYMTAEELEQRLEGVEPGKENAAQHIGAALTESGEMITTKFSENPVDYFGKQLLQHGYQYYGCETMYSGIHGCEMSCQIFLGVIYYQRLRHMVSDKWQCRSIGPIDHLTRQPLKGRKRGGGVRLGEMERDALLGHGASFMLQDRLLNCSDGHYTYACPKCGSILSPCIDISATGAASGGSRKEKVSVCRVCNIPCRRLLLPYVFRYISNELAAMNIAIKLQLTECDKPVKTDQKIQWAVESVKEELPPRVKEEI